MRRRSSTPPFQLFSFQDIITSVMGIVILILLVLAVELSKRQLTSSASQHVAVSRETEQTLTEVTAQIAALRSELDDASFTELAAVSAVEIAEADAYLSQAIPKAEADRVEAKRRLAQLENRFREESEDLGRLTAEAKIPEKRSQGESLEQQLHDQEGRVNYRTAAPAGKQAWLIELALDRFLIARIGVAEPPLQLVETNVKRRSDRLLEWARGLEPRSNVIHLLVKPGVVEPFDHIETALRRRGFALGFDVLGQDQKAIDLKSGTGSIAPTAEPHP